MKELEPYLNKITQGDCLEVLKQLPDKCIDLVLTDPPYGINADKGSNFYGHTGGREYNDNWDSITPPKEVFEELLRIGKKVIIFGGNFFTDKLPVNGHWIFWDKKGDIAFDNPFGDGELAWTNIDRKSVKKYVSIQQGFISDEKVRFHPTQKPVGLFKKIIEDYNTGGVILDCYLGSGTTVIACKELGLDFIGIEKEQKYVDIANERLSKMTGNLF